MCYYEKKSATKYLTFFRTLTDGLGHLPEKRRRKIISCKKISKLRGVKKPSLPRGEKYTSKFGEKKTPRFYKEKLLLVFPR